MLSINNCIVLTPPWHWSFQSVKTLTVDLTSQNEFKKTTGSVVAPYGSETATLAQGCTRSMPGNHGSSDSERSEFVSLGAEALQAPCFLVKPLALGFLQWRILKLIPHCKRAARKLALLKSSVLQRPWRWPPPWRTSRRIWTLRCHCLTGSVGQAILWANA